MACRRSILPLTCCAFHGRPDLGFRQVEHGQLPHKVFGDCMNCPKFNACDEIAMLLELEPATDQAPMTGPLSRPIPGLFQGPFPTRVDASETKDA